MKKLSALVITAALLLVGSPSSAQSGQEGRATLYNYIVVEVDANQCARTGWVLTCVPTEAHHIQDVEVDFVVLADLPVWSDNGPWVKNVAIDWCVGFSGTCDLDVHSQGKTGWVQGGGVGVVVHAPAMGYTVDRVTGAWSTPTASGVLPT